MGANIMLAVHCKKAEPLELRGPVQDYIAATYGDSAAQDAAEDLETIEGQRAQIVGMGGSLPSLRDLMAKCEGADSPTPARPAHLFPCARQMTAPHGSQRRTYRHRISVSVGRTAVVPP